MRVFNYCKTQLTKGAAQLKGLKHVEVHFEVWNGLDLGEENSSLEEMSKFKHHGGIEWLKNIGLKTVCFTVMAFGKAPKDDAIASILDWMKREEDEILSQ
jgi:hypothetical protein